ncbi:hypothetical protein QOT17_016862 [Balamuthia mandrillaris]
MRALSLVLNDLEMIRYYQGQLSHQALQYEVDPETFKSKGIRYASDYVRDAIYEQKLENNPSELGRAIHELQGALAGEIFERYATSRLAPGGCFRIYPLHPDGGKAAWPLPVPGFTAEDHTAEDACTIENLLRGLAERDEKMGGSRR